MFNTLDVIKGAVADQLQLGGISALSTPVADMCSPAQSWAYNRILSILGSRGWTLAQITQWDEGPICEQELACFRVLSRVGGLYKLTDEMIKGLDWREALQKDVELTIAGVWQAPQGTAGQVQTGPIAGEQVPDCWDRNGSWRGEW